MGGGGGLGRTPTFRGEIAGKEGVNFLRRRGIAIFA